MTAAPWPAAGLALVRDGARLGECTTCGGAGSFLARRVDDDWTRAVEVRCPGCGGLTKRLLFNEGGAA